MQVTYGYYADEYGGRTIPEQDFRKAERQAEAYIRHLTYVKGDIFAVENDAVKDAVCAAAEVYYKYNAQQQPTHAPESRQSLPDWTVSLMLQSRRMERQQKRL